MTQDARDSTGATLPGEAARYFLLSPARCDGQRAGTLLDPGASSELARALQSTPGVPLGELFTFLSSLYFRGKLTYARLFARPEHALPGVFIITSGEGLQTEAERIDARRLRAFSQVQVRCTNTRYTAPLQRDAEALAQKTRPDAQFVLLGSVASGKYIDVLLGTFGERLLFPVDFVGRGDMSRGGLLLRSAAAGTELAYVPVQGATLHGNRPPRLPRLPRDAPGSKRT